MTPTQGRRTGLASAWSQTHRRVVGGQRPAPPHPAREAGEAGGGGRPPAPAGPRG